MTANQVAYQQMLEAKRHNMMEEGLKGDIQDAQKMRLAAQSEVDRRNASSNEKNAETALYDAKTKRHVGNSQVRLNNSQKDLNDVRAVREGTGIVTDIIGAGIKGATGVLSMFG